MQALLKTTHSKRQGMVYIMSRIKNAGSKICTFDIETTNLNADFGVILCAAYSMNGRKVELISQRDHGEYLKGDATNDKQLVVHLLAKLAEADFWMAHNGAQFDIPFLWSRAAYWRLPTPAKRAILDPVIIARRQFKLSSNSLDALSKYFCIANKTTLDRRIWLRASLSRDIRCLKYIEEHCKRDVRVLLELAPFFRGVWRHLGSTGSFY